jgi:hypothetical protein
MTSNVDPYGSLAALFTTPAAPEASHGHSAPRIGEVTTVLVGNLPVMAGLWTTQLADEVARAFGPTGLVRFERGEVTLEILRADGRQVPPAGPGAVSRWLPRSAGALRRWLVCVPADTAPAEYADASERIVLMLGADEAAVTGGYLRLKQLCDEGIHRGRPVDRVGIVVVGASPEQADAAFRRLGDAARSFLGLEVDLVARLPRIERVESSARASYPGDECPGIGAFLGELATARSQAAHRFDAEDDVPASIPIDGSVQPKSVPARPQPTVAPMNHAPAMNHAAAMNHAPAAAARSAPAYAALPMAELPPRLVPLLRGLRPLGIACPLAPELELALDDEHRMHIVGRSDQLARVRTVRTWATMHAELLGLAFPELKGGFEVRERILLGDARDAIVLHGTGALLDVLVVAQTPSGPVQVVVPLNDPTTCG